MIWFIFFALVLFASPVEATARFMASNGLTSGTCTTSGTACRFDRVVAVAACGDTITMINGTYQGINNMMDFDAHPPANPTCSAGNRITMQAETEGGVFIDAQFSTYPIFLNGISYWTFQGFDAGNAGGSPNNSILELWFSHHNEFKRMCFSNTFTALNNFDGDGVRVDRESSNNLFEDICSFGSGGNNFIDKTDATNNTYRRMWLRWEGRYGPYPGSGGTDCGSPPLQLGYGAHHTSTFENIISVYDPEQTTTPDYVGQPDGTCYGPTNTTHIYGSVLIRDTAFVGDSGYQLRGWIIYGYDNPNIPIVSPSDADWFKQAAVNDGEGGNPRINIQDMFIDSLSQPSTGTRALAIGCTSGDCAATSVNRITTVKGVTQPVNTYSNSGQYTAFTNTNECTSLAACPNFYTGTVGSTLGARNCFRYVDGTLTSTPLWPWPMDDRIKAALTRARTAGTGGSALAGSAGSGYAANTVTSEIVSRYGSIPTACLTASSFTPSFPVASDFPSVTVRDDFNRVDAPTLGTGWTELLSDTFDLVSNAAAAPSAGLFARAIYSDTKMQTSHEVYATWTTLPAAGSVTFLSFAGTDLTVNNQYRLRVNRTAGVNTTAEVIRVDGVGAETTVLSAVDLGIEVVDGNSFGVRVSGTTISVYWKWTDGIWYRFGQFTDSNLSSLPSTGVYGGIAGGTSAVIDNYGAGPFVDQPVQEPPSLPLNTNRGRFGTTFPGVR